jgi:two-component system LytT family response regulator
MIKAILIDDEENARITLGGLLDGFCPEVKVVAEAETVEKGIAAILEHEPDLVFLDIRLNPGSGFDVLDALDSIDFEVIFVTAYNEYAIRAIRFSALDYLQKPVDVDDLVAAVDRLKEKQKEDKTALQFEIFKDALNAQYGRIVLPTLEGFVVVELKEIIRCEADRNYTHFFLHPNRKLTISRTLKVYDELLGENGFVRIHQSHLINLAQIREYKRRKKGGIIFLADGTELPVSESRKDELMRRLGG